MAHTPGPWTAGRPDMGTVVDGIVSKWIYAGEQYVAIASGRIDGDWDEVIANARLIAAAPALLEALKEALVAQPDLDAVRRWERKARAAIAEAEGRG